MIIYNVHLPKMQFRCNFNQIYRQSSWDIEENKDSIEMQSDYNKDTIWMQMWMQSGCNPDTKAWFFTQSKQIEQ